MNASEAMPRQTRAYLIYGLFAALLLASGVYNCFHFVTAADPLLVGRAGFYLLEITVLLVLGLPFSRDRLARVTTARFFVPLYILTSGLLLTAVIAVALPAQKAGLFSFPSIALLTFAASIPFLLCGPSSSESSGRGLTARTVILFFYMWLLPGLILLAASWISSNRLDRNLLFQGTLWRELLFWGTSLPAFIALIRRDRLLGDNSFTMSFSATKTSLWWFVLCTVVISLPAVLGRLFVLETSSVINPISHLSRGLAFTFVFTAFQEEVCWRGYIPLLRRSLVRLSNRITPRMAEYGSIVLPAFLFGLSHYSPNRPLIILPSTFLMGVGLGVLYSRTQSLFLCIFSHALINTLFGC